MAWNEKQLQWSPSAATIQSDAEAVLNQINAQSQQGLNQLSAISSNAAYQRNTLSAKAEGILSLRQKLDALLESGQVLTVTPYQYGVGLVESNGHFLSASNAINTLSIKLKDKADDNRPLTSQYALMVLITAETLADYHAKIVAFCKVLPLPDVLALQRRLAAELIIKQERMLTPAVDAVPRFKPSSALNNSPLRQALQWQGAQITQLESLAADRETPITKLKQLAAKRKKVLQQLTDDINHLKKNAAKTWVFATQGSVETIAAELEAQIVPNTTDKFSVAVMFLAPTKMDFLREVLNV
ncbi:hypothetical protein VXS03_14185 [Photobacterium sp. S4TG1]|uniref:hypothetical protein n=1 Tax=Photobacterium sp. S4TG1 TaxID=3114587 RepID=UPI002E173AB4|nr:hypothetical protein [Photobacterium sp. S4TG1]